MKITLRCDAERCPGGTIEFGMPDPDARSLRLHGECDTCGARFALYGGQRYRLVDCLAGVA